MTLGDIGDYLASIRRCRAWARAVESGPGGQDLARPRGDCWKRCLIRAHPRGRIYPLACLIAIGLRIHRGRAVDPPIHQQGWTVALHPDGTTTARSPDGTKIFHSHSPPARAG